MMELIIKDLLLEKEYGFSPTSLFKLEGNVIKSGKFQTGANVLIGTEFDPIWSFCYTIGKRKPSKSKGKEKIYLDGKETSLNKLKKMTHYLAYYEEKFPHNIFNATVKQHIKRALKKSKIKYSYKEIIEMFQLEEVFLNRKFKYLGRNRWLYSFAIGFAKGKKVFCSRWMSEEEFGSQLYRLNIMENIAKKEDLIMIIPVEGVKHFFMEESGFTYRIVELE